MCVLHLALKTAAVGAASELVETPRQCPGIHTAFPELRAHRLCHQLGDDSGH
jgi:hypothetical protein